MPYCFSRPSVKFQGHTGWKINDLNPIWVRFLGRSQSSIKSLRFALLDFHRSVSFLLQFSRGRRVNGERSFVQHGQLYNSMCTMVICTADVWNGTFVQLHSCATGQMKKTVTCTTGYYEWRIGKILLYWGTFVQFTICNKKVIQGMCSGHFYKCPGVQMFFNSSLYRCPVVQLFGFTRVRCITGFISTAPGLILGLRPANERRCYFVTTSLIGWEQAKNQSCAHCTCVHCTVHYFVRAPFRESPHWKKK